MCRSSSPHFGVPGFRRFSRDEYERCVRQARAFRQEGMGPGVIMSTNRETRLVRDGCDRRDKRDYQLPDVPVT